jgi:hypothetical protein
MAALGLVVACPPPASGQPLITARVVPAANAAGWHDAPAVVEFNCRDVAGCPEAVQVTHAGWHQAVGEARLADGATVSTTLDVGLDLEPPTVVFEGLPGAAVQATLRIRASVADALSGVASASCNGLPAAIDADRVTCEVSLEPGHNEIIVQATDRAGNSGSAGATIARTGAPTLLVPLPSQLTLLVGDEKTLQVTDEFGVARPDATLTVSDPSVLELAGRLRIAARAPGQATVSIAWRALRAEVAVVVAAGERLELNTQHWAVGQEPGSQMLDVIYTHPLAGLDTILLQRRASGRVVARALATLDDLPVLRWVQTPAIRSDERIVQTMGETFGGGLLRVEAPDGAGAIVRIGQPDRDGGIPLWRFEAPGRLGRMVQGWDGTVFALETTRDGYPRVLVIDGRTGRVRSRVALPRSARGPAACDGLGWPREAPAGIGIPFIPEGRELALEFATVEDDAVRDCRLSARTARLRIAMLRVDAAGPPARPSSRSSPRRRVPRSHRQS